jgi:hypothetical protein
MCICVGLQPQAVYSVMLQAVVEAGEYERAVQMLDDVYLHAERGGPTGKCLEVVVRAHLERGELEEALDTVSIFQNRPSIQTFMLMVHLPPPLPPPLRAAPSAHTCVHWMSERVREPARTLSGARLYPRRCGTCWKASGPTGSSRRFTC